MVTLANVRGESLAPDLSQFFNILFSQKQSREREAGLNERQRLELEAEAAQQGAIQEQIGVLTGRETPQPGRNIESVPAATGKAQEKALLRLISIDPATGNSVSNLLKVGGAQARDDLRATAETGLRQAAFVSGKKDFAGKQRALTSLAADAVAKGQPLDRLIQLQNLSEPELDLELERMKIMGTDLKTLTAPAKAAAEQFEAVTDAQGNIIGQRSLTSGKVVSDPRAGAAPTPSTPIGKARQDLKSGFITQDDFNTIKSTPKKFQTDVGKSIADKQLAIELFGEDSEQVNAIAASIASDKKGEVVKLSDVAGMRKEHTKLSSDTIALGTSIKKIRQGAENPSAAGDLAMIFSFMKMLDPSSVVREGEFATAAQAAGVPERIIGQYNRILRGERLTPSQRKDFLDTSNLQWEAQIGTQRQLDQNFRDLAERQNINPEDVVIDFIGGEVTAAPVDQVPAPAQVITQPEAPAPTAIQEGTTATNPSTGQKIIFRGGQWQTL